MDEVPMVGVCRGLRGVALAGFFVVVGILFTQQVAAAGLLTDSGTYREPSLPSLPAAGGKLTDPTFGTTIMRLTDSRDGTDCRVEYSYWPTFNANSTRAKALCVVNGVDRTRIWTFDPVAATRGTSTLMNQPLQSSDTIWSHSDPDVLYGHSRMHRLLAYNVVTQTATTVKDFTSVVPSGGQLQQMSMSSDDDVFAFHITNSSNAGVGYIVWRRSTNTFLINRAETNIDEVQIDKTGTYLAVGYRNGNNRVWNLQTRTFTDLSWGLNGYFHHDAGRGTMLTYTGDTRGFGYRQLATPQVVQPLLLVNTSNRTGHLSMRADNEGWGLISHYNNNGSSVGSPFENEIFQVATDGSGSVRRIAHHRSVYNDYFDGPFANISKDGRFVAFSSNWGNPNGRRDVFVAVIPAASTSAPLTCPAAALAAFTACYYENDNFTDLHMVRTDAYPVAFDWGNSSPEPAMGPDSFSVEWTGNFAFEAGTYTFTTTADDGVRLYVDGQLILDKWLNQPATTYNVAKTMTAGTHRVRLVYYEAYAGAVAKLSWRRTQ